MLEDSQSTKLIAAVPTRLHRVHLSNQIVRDKANRYVLSREPTLHENGSWQIPSASVWILLPLDHSADNGTNSGVSSEDNGNKPTLRILLVHAQLSSILITKELLN
ncbi:uncharacterized protein [Choristoneura fumiferana]|uniref:uncharacterized protein n=1 Tax=Choristoneura fumiferana TaxID=7141 RepID=UPI003D15D07C